mmetsp:Transcript_54970/g.161626  ORF Transcript_54970/g.161626 Transcript_54970/m.161626 type:complete len:200 (+) Transcript_54970:1744-2343(+)
MTCSTFSPAAQWKRSLTSMFRSSASRPLRFCICAANWSGTSLPKVPRPLSRCTSPFASMSTSMASPTCPLSTVGLVMARKISGVKPSWTLSRRKTLGSAPCSRHACTLSTRLLALFSTSFGEQHISSLWDASASKPSNMDMVARFWKLVFAFVRSSACLVPMYLEAAREQRSGPHCFSHCLQNSSNSAMLMRPSMLLST